MSTSAATRKPITLKSSDGGSFEVDEAVAMQSQIIKHIMIDDENHGADDDDNGAVNIALPHVTSSVLAKVIDYCNKHVVVDAAGDSDDDVEDVERRTTTWDREFVKVDEDTLWDLLLAANYLEIKGLLDLTYGAVVEMVKGKSDPEIKRVLNLGDHLQLARNRRTSWACI